MSLLNNGYELAGVILAIPATGAILIRAWRLRSSVKHRLQERRAMREVLLGTPAVPPNPILGEPGRPAVPPLAMQLVALREDAAGQFEEIKSALGTVKDRMDKEFGGNSGGLRQQTTEIAKAVAAKVVEPEKHD